MPPLMVAEMTYRWQRPGRYSGEIGLYATPSIRFFDSGGRIAAFDKEMQRVQERSYNAHQQAIAAQGMARRFWFGVEKHHQNTKERIIKKALRYTAKLLRADYEKVALKMAWPSASSEFTEPSSAAEVREMISELLASDKGGIWFQMRPIVA
jgi:hypothetical protein